MIGTSPATATGIEQLPREPDAGAIGPAVRKRLGVCGCARSGRGGLPVADQAQAHDHLNGPDITPVSLCQRLWGSRIVTRHYAPAIRLLHSLSILPALVAHSVETYRSWPP